MSTATRFVNVETTCMCGATQSVSLPEEAYESWSNGELLQRAWPEGTVEEREALISGTCSDCWERMEAMWS